MMTTRTATLVAMAMAIICTPSWAQTPVERVETKQPLVAITFDDGPNPVNAPKLLALFKKTGVKATFFVNGNNVRKHPELAKRMLAEGHELGNHTTTHPDLAKLGDLEKVRKEIEDTQRILKETVGKPAAVFRAPFLSHDKNVWAVLNGMPSINASRLTTDWSGDSTAQSIFDQATRETKAGDIVLMHSWQNKTIEAMPRIIKALQAKGLKLVTVSELLAAAKKPVAPAAKKKPGTAARKAKGSKGKRVFLTDRAGGKNLWYTHLNTPHAMYHGGKTYITFHGGGSDYLDPLVVSYDHKTRKMRGPVKVGDNPLAKPRDHHGNPALIVDDAGYIHVIYGGHGHHRGQMRHAVSERPHDISAWQHLKNINTQTTYPQLLKMSDGTIYYFYRQGNHRTDWVYVTSKDNGRTFSKEIPVMAGGKKRTDGEYLDGVYYDAWYGSFYKGRDDTIHHVTRYHGCANDYSQPYHLERRVHLYHLQMTHGKGEWTNLTGRKLELPVTREQADKHCRVFESRPKTGHGKVIAVRSGGFDVGPKGRVYVVYGHGRGRGGSIDRKWTVAIGDPSSGKWLTHEVPQGGQLTVEEDGSLKLWGDRIAVSQDGGRSWETGAALREQGLSGVALVYNGRPEARVVAHDPRPEDPAGWQNRKIFLWGEEGFITPRSGER